MRRAFRVLIIVAVALGVVASAGIVGVRRSLPTREGQLTMPGLAKPVEVRRDSYGVPQIYADTADDLFRAQGYVHAQDRFFEMDLRRHFASGRLSEWFGEDQLQTDVFFRTLGWRQVAEAEFPKLAPKTQSYFAAYSAGVNSYLAERSGGELSVEYTLGLLGPSAQPDQWTPIDSLMWLKAMAWDLRRNMGDEINRVIVSSRIPDDRVAELFPPYPYKRHAPIVTTPVEDPQLRSQSSSSSPTPGESSTADQNAVPAGSVGVLQKVQGLLQSLPPQLGGADLLSEQSGVGSNSWVVAGSMTMTGKPLLANDPHLSPSMPSIWYQMGLHCRTKGPDCPFDVSGFTFSGLPGVMIGHNDRVAWGFTNLGSDVTDLYVEKLRGNSYLYDGRWLPLKSWTELIWMKGRDMPESITVRSTQRGPLLSDADAELRHVSQAAPVSGQARTAETTLAASLQWTALIPGKTADAIFLLNRAQNFSEFRRAASLFEVPSQNLVYADVDGHIGYQASGKVPIRRGGDGTWPMPGWSSDYGWVDWVPFSQLPFMRDPPEGYIVTANQAVTGPGYPFHLTDTWSYGYRSDRIADSLDALTADGNKVSLDAMAQLQLDTKNGAASFVVPYLLKTRVTPNVAQGQELLRGWNLQQPPSSAAAAYFNSVWKYLLRLTFADELPESAQPAGGDRWFELLRRLLADPSNRWWDDVSTQDVREDRDAILTRAMSSAQDELTKLLGKDPTQWRWGKLHQLTLKSQTFGSSGVPPLDFLFNRGPYEVGGSNDSVLATPWPASTDGLPGYAATWVVPSMRMIVDLADLDRSRWINLTGASGHPMSPNYVDQTALWVQGVTIAWPYSRSAVTDAARSVLTLTP